MKPKAKHILFRAVVPAAIALAVCFTAAPAAHAQEPNEPTLIGPAKGWVFRVITPRVDEAFARERARLLGVVGPITRELEGFRVSGHLQSVLVYTASGGFEYSDANGICGHSLRPSIEEAIKRLCNQLA